VDDGESEMAADLLTVVIKTLCRPTIIHTIESALAEGMRVVVCSDGRATMPLLSDFVSNDRVDIYQLGRAYCQRGAVAFQTGATLAKTDFVFMVDDDDELIPGSGTIIESKMASDPSIDLWIPGLKYNDGSIVCMNAGQLRVGNVACEIVRTEILGIVPFLRAPQSPRVQDYVHIKQCRDAGYKVGWIGEPCVAVRPKLPGKHGYADDGSLLKTYPLPQ
jgi:hypothetical protein